MARVTGIGGIFFRARDPHALKRWYREHLGLGGDDPACAAIFDWAAPDQTSTLGFTVWQVFENDTAYFGPERPPFMINYRVDDLDALLARLRAAGVPVDGPETHEPNGRFAWATDPEGNRFELWEPAG